MNSVDIDRIIERKIEEATSYSYSCLMGAFAKDALLGEVLAFGKGIPHTELVVDEREGYVGHDCDPHVTIKYGIHSEKWEDVAKVIDGMIDEPFEATLGELSMFENDVDVLKISIDSPKLRELNAHVTENMEVTDTYPEYIPHVTIAYMKSGTAKKYIDSYAEIFKGKKISIDTLLFSSKDGSETKIKL